LAQLFCFRLVVVVMCRHIYLELFEKMYKENKQWGGGGGGVVQRTVPGLNPISVLRIYSMLRVLLCTCCLWGGEGRWCPPTIPATCLLCARAPSTRDLLSPVAILAQACCVYHPPAHVQSPRPPSMELQIRMTVPDRNTELRVIGSEWRNSSTLLGLPGLRQNDPPVLVLLLENWTPGLPPIYYRVVVVASFVRRPAPPFGPPTFPRIVGSRWRTL
jgi:hypothetical protein